MVVEGILYADIYGLMLSRLVADHEGVTHCYRFEVGFEETLRRHATKPQANEYGADAMRGWWRDGDFLSDVDEHVIGPEVSLAQATDAVLFDCGWVSSTA